MILRIYSLLLIVVITSSCSSSRLITKPSSNITDAMKAALVWQEAHPIYAKAPTDWTNGAYYTGVSRAYLATKDPTFVKAMKDMAIRNDWQTWDRYYHADDVAISYTYLILQELGHSQVDIVPTASFINDHLFKDHSWKNGKDPDPNKSILWWWCDALFMAPPVIAKYAVNYDEPQLLNSLHLYYKETYDLLFDQEEQLFTRDKSFLWDENNQGVKEANGRKVFWSRGNGWVLGGLALLLETLPYEDPNRDFYLTIFKKMSERIIELQPEDGLWRTSLLCPESYTHGEVSGTGFYTFALAWGINQGILDKKTYLPHVKKAWSGLLSCQQADGKVGWVQNIGKSPEPATADSWQNYGTGAFLLAGSEVLKLEER